MSRSSTLDLLRSYGLPTSGFYAESGGERLTVFEDDGRSDDTDEEE